MGRDVPIAEIRFGRADHSRMVPVASSFDRAACSRFPREAPHDVDQLAVSDAGGIAELIERVRIGRTAQADELRHWFR